MIVWRRRARLGLARPAPGVVDWSITLAGDVARIEAAARDEAGNEELTPHVVTRSGSVAAAE